MGEAVQSRREGVFAPHVRALTLGLVLTITLVGFEALAIATVLPVVEKDLGDLSLYGWVFSAYLLASLVGAVVAGREADRLGPATPFAVGCLLFGAGLVAGGLAPSMPFLVGARVVQGLGAGVVPAVAYAVIGRAYDESLRARMFAVLSTAWVVPAVLGPGLAGFVEHALGWRWVFLGLLPILALAAFISLPALRGVSMGGESDEPGARTLDAVLVAVGAGLVIGGLTAVDQPVVVPVLVVAGIAVLYRPIRRLVPRGTFTVRAGLPAAVFVRGVMTFAFFGTDAFIPLVIQDVRHESVTYTSVVLTVTTLSWTAAAWVQERLIGRFGARAFVRAGFLCILVGIAGVVATLSSSVPVWVVVPSWMLGCVGMGFGYAPLSLVMLKEAEPGREGTASASLNLSDQLGFAFGTGVSGAAVALGESVDWAGATSLRIGGTITALVALTGVVLASRIPRTT